VVEKEEEELIGQF